MGNSLLAVREINHKYIVVGIKFGIDLALTGGIGSIANLTMKSVIKKSKKVLGELDEEAVIKDIKEKLDYKELREDIKEFREKFAKLIEEAGIEKLVIFVDELVWMQSKYYFRYIRSNEAVFI